MCWTSYEPTVCIIDCLTWWMSVVLACILHPPNPFLCKIASDYVLHLRHWLVIYCISIKNFNADKNYVSHGGSTYLFAFPAQFASQKPLKAIFLPPRHNLESKVPFLMCFTTIQWGGTTFDINWLIILYANAIFALMVIIAYMRDPIMALYGTPFIFFCTFPRFSSKNSNNFDLASNGVLTGLYYFMLKRLRTSSM